MATPAADVPEILPERLLLFDGVCGFCDGAVRWLIARDPTARLHFAPLQGEAAERLRARHPEIPRDLDSVVLVERAADAEERVHLRSQAVLRALAQIEGPWRWLAGLRVLPAALLDPAYALFARWRYRLFGRRDECRIPSPGERARFLD